MIYLLDTNILSEIMQPEPSEAVHRWVIQKEVGDLFVSATTIHEIVFGIRRLPLGRRRSVLEVAFRELFEARFAKRVISFDEAAAIRCGEIRADVTSKGRPVGFADCEIAAVALTRSMVIATRNLADFAPFGVPLVDPFDPKASA